jgi:hypothetical protein
MKRKMQFLLVVFSLALPSAVWGQGAFRNLDFEQATPTPPSILPDWILYSGTIGYNTVGIGGSAITLHDSMSTHFQPLQGNYSVLLQGSQANAPTSAAIGQTGQIPAGSLSLRFWVFPASNLQVTFAGQVIPIYSLSSTANHDVYGGDISMFAGQTGELRFTANAGTAGFFDNIFFSTQQIPEPSALGLFGLGALIVASKMRRLLRG